MNGIIAVLSGSFHCISVFSPKTGPSVGSAFETGVGNDILADIVTTGILNHYFGSNQRFQVHLFLLRVPQKTVSVHFGVCRNGIYKSIYGSEVQFTLVAHHCIMLHGISGGKGVEVCIGQLLHSPVIYIIVCSDA